MKPMKAVKQLKAKHDLRNAVKEALEGCDNTTGIIRNGKIFLFPDGHAWQYSAEKITTAQGEVYIEAIFR